MRIKSGLLLSLLFLTGCADFENLISDRLANRPTMPQPTYWIAAQENQQAFFDLSIGAPRPKSGLPKKLEGIDGTKVLVACIWLNEETPPKPVVYVPVNDFDLFLDSLAEKFPVNRAIASTFRCGKREYVVTLGQQYAKITASLKAARNSPDSPDAFLPSLPINNDVVVGWNPEASSAEDLAKLGKFAEKAFGQSLASLFQSDSPMIAGFDLDSSSGIQIQIHKDKESQSLRSELEKQFATKNLASKSDSLLFQVSDSTGNSESELRKRFELASTSFFRTQIAAQAKRSARNSIRHSDSPLGIASEFSKLQDGYVSNESGSRQCSPSAKRG